jgi:hypothetical protein
MHTTSASVPAAAAAAAGVVRGEEGGVDGRALRGGADGAGGMRGASVGARGGDCRLEGVAREGG